MRLRSASESDRRLLLEWRNDPETRAASLNQDAVSDADHDAWFARVLVDPDVFVYVGEVDGEPVGTVRFDLDQDRRVAEVSINVGPAHRGRGLARALLQHSVDAVRDELGAGVTFLARIRPVNTASIRLFEHLGFLQAGVDEDGIELYELA